MNTNTSTITNQNTNQNNHELLMETAWLTTKQASQILQINADTLRRFSAARLIDSRCARKMGKNLRWSREVLVREGLLLKNV